MKERSRAIQWFVFALVLVSLTLTPSALCVLKGWNGFHLADFARLLSGELRSSGATALLACLLSLPVILFCEDLPPHRKRVFYTLAALPLLMPWPYLAWITRKALTDFGISLNVPLQLLFSALWYMPIPFFIVQYLAAGKRPGTAHLLTAMLIAAAIRICVWPSLLPEWSNPFALDMSRAEMVPTISFALLQRSAGTQSSPILYTGLMLPLWGLVLVWVKRRCRGREAEWHVPKRLRAFCGVVSLLLALLFAAVFPWEIGHYAIPAFARYAPDVGRSILHLLPCLACSILCGAVGVAVCMLVRRLLRWMPEKMRRWRWLGAVFSPTVLLWLAFDRGLLQENTLASLMIATALVTGFVLLFFWPYRREPGAPVLLAVFIFSGFLLLMPGIVSAPQPVRNAQTLQHMFYTYIHPVYAQFGFSGQRELYVVSATMLLYMSLLVILGEWIVLSCFRERSAYEKKMADSVCGDCADSRDSGGAGLVPVAADAGNAGSTADGGGAGAGEAGLAGQQRYPL